MLALVSTGHPQGHVALQQIDVPNPDSHEAVVAVHAISLNRGELRRLKSKPAGWRPGWDVAGVVKQAARDGSGPPAGTRVVGLVNDKGWAQYVAIPTKTLGTLPDTCGFAVAATLPVAGLTALCALRCAGLLIGKDVLITGASGGVGRFAIQLARLAGANVSALVGGTRSCDDLAELGAHRVLMPGQFESKDAYNIALDSVGGDTLVSALKSIRNDGKIVTFGNSSQKETTFNVSDFYGRTFGATLYAFELFHELERSQSCTNDLQTLTHLVAEGKLKSSIALEEPWENMGKALQALEERGVAGKAVLHIKQ